MKIKILHIVTRIDVGGISTFLLNYFKHMNKNYISFDVVAIDTGIKQGYHQIFEDLGMKVYYMPNSISNRTIYLLNLIKKNKYDVVHSHIELQSSYYLSLAALAGVKNRISHAHLSKDNPGLKNQLMRQVLNRIATYKAGASDLSLKAVFGNGSDKNSFVINNAIDVDQFQFDNNQRLLIRKELNIQSNEIILGFVGRLSSQKNIIYLNKILHECSKVASNISLLIVGEGELFEDMRSDLQKKGILNKVKFLGNRDNVGEIMMAMDILLLPSLFEGLPLVLVEAQCTSLRCLVSDKITKLVKLTDDIEYLGISNQDINKWVERIISIGNTYPRGITNKFQITEKNFNIKEEAKNLEKMYKDLVYN